MADETLPARPLRLRPDPPRPLAARLSAQELLVAQTLAETLHEEQVAPKAQIARLVAILGAPTAQALAEEAQRVFAGPGMLTKNGKRQRTLGGIFFRLAYDQATPEQRQRIQPFPHFVPLSQRKRRKPTASESPAPPPSILPTNLGEITQEVATWTAQERGAALSAVLKIIGRPEKIRENGQAIYFSLTSTHIPSLPKGVPAVPAGTRYLVVVGKKQWEKVAQVLTTNAEEHLLLEGYPVLHPQFAGITVLTTSCLVLSSRKARGKLPKEAPTETASEREETAPA